MTASPASATRLAARRAAPRLLALALLALLALTARPAAAQGADPLEPVNRRIHALNRLVQAHAFGPLAELYAAHIPAGIRQGAANLLANLGEPLTAFSGLAAGDLDRAIGAAARFGINTTLGIAGIQDRATAMGYPRRPFAMADALCRWGVPSGPYLVLPLLGPSTLRDFGAAIATGALLSQALGPDIVLAWGGTDAFIAYAELHPELARIEAESLDSYAVHRSAYRQRRAALCATDAVQAAMAAPEDK